MLIGNVAAHFPGETLEFDAQVAVVPEAQGSERVSDAVVPEGMGGQGVSWRGFALASVTVSDSGLGVQAFWALGARTRGLSLY